MLRPFVFDANASQRWADAGEAQWSTHDHRDKNECALGCERTCDLNENDDGVRGLKAANALLIALSDFRRGHLIVDR